MLQGAELLREHYGEPSFQSRRKYRGYSRRVTGDGWLAIGDAAFFVDPLISPGLAGGTATAFKAARDTAAALDESAMREDSFAEYESFAHELHRALERDNQLVYMSFNRPDTLALIQRFQEVDARRHFLTHARDNYDINDTNVWGVLDGRYQDRQKQAWAIMREAEEAQRLPASEQSPKDYASMQKQLENLLGDYVDSNAALTPFVVANP